jgi:hypothetical protein
MLVTGNSFVKIGGSFIDYSGPFVPPEPPVDHYFQLTNRGSSSAVLYVTSGSRGQIFVNEEYVGTIGGSQSSFLIPAGGVVKITGLTPRGSSWYSGTLTSDSSSNNFSIDRFDDTVSNPDYMFCRFTGLRAITSWTGAGNYTSLHDTFAICKELSSIPASWTGLDSVTQMIGTFNSCALTTIPSSYDGLGKLTIATNVFDTGEEGTTATIISGGDSGFTQLSNLTNCDGMFWDQSNWTGDALSLYNYLSTKSITVTEHRNTFAGCVNAIGYSQIPESWGGGKQTPQTWFKLEIDAVQSSSTFMLGEFRFIDLNGTQVGTYTADSWTTGTNYSTYGEQSAIYLFDGIINDYILKYCVRSSRNIYVIFKANDITSLNNLRYQLCTAGDCSTWRGRNPASWRLYSASEKLPRDSSSWNLIDQRINDTTMKDIDSTWYTFNLN